MWLLQGELYQLLQCCLQLITRLLGGMQYTLALHKATSTLAADTHSISEAQEDCYSCCVCDRTS